MLDEEAAHDLIKEASSLSGGVPQSLLPPSLTLREPQATPFSNKKAWRLFEPPKPCAAAWQKTRRE